MILDLVVGRDPVAFHRGIESAIRSPDRIMDHLYFQAVESEEFEDCCVLDKPREGRKYNTNPQYEFYAKYRAQIRGTIVAIPEQTQLNP